MFRHIIVAFVLFITVQTANPYRDSRQACDCTPGEEPQCGCQVVPSMEVGKSFQMLCSCSAPVPPKCVCRETPLVTATPVVPSSAPAVRCVDVCKRSCLEPCSRLSSNGKCDQVCSDACSYSCTKQEKTASTMDDSSSSFIGEYKFIIPTTNPPTPSSTLLPSSLPPVIIGNSIMSPTPVVPPKVCEPDCMPECNFACTTFKPALKLITDVVEGKAAGNSGSCQQNCGETCVKVCGTTGIALGECATNCATACSETCGIVAKKTITCISQCMPQCNPQCVQIQTEIQVLGAVPPQPAMIVTATAAPVPPALVTRCEAECKVECEHQCGVHTLSGPQCLAACQTTCYPVCQAKLRRKHMRQLKKQQN